MEKEQFLILLEKYQSNTATQEEWTLLREQVQHASYQELMELNFDQLLAIRQLHPSWSPEKEDKIWQQISLRRKVNRLPMIYRWMAAAAVIGIIGVIWYWFTPLKTDIYITKAGERRTVVLSDSTVVMLNAASKLSVHPTYGNTLRDVTLEGEAWFQVKHMAGSRFVLHTRDADIVDLGTTFNVRAYGNEKKTEATLIEGSIVVTPKNAGDREQFTLEPMQKLVLAPKAANKQVTRLFRKDISVAVDTLASPDGNTPLTEIAWTENKLVFRNEPLKEVVIKLTQWYGVEVVLKNDKLAEILLSGTFKMESLDAVLGIMKEVVSELHYKKEGDKIILY